MVTSCSIWNQFQHHHHLTPNLFLLLPFCVQPPEKEDNAAKMCLDPPWGINSQLSLPPQCPRPKLMNPKRASGKPQQFQLPMPSSYHMNLSPPTSRWDKALRGRLIWEQIEHLWGCLLLFLPRLASEQWLKWCLLPFTAWTKWNCYPPYPYLHRACLGTGTPTELPQVGAGEEVLPVSPSPRSLILC